eukprot:TRINITY_DN7427_c0_g1_i1.p1 TRINITY_DN7427_c0_g1~~TRINITY_DN7427_c0_g1_i1.p1  ORF type:complete len:200 (+),score=22.00 TRINITY_DN7427_c0_g1_i1:42-641(+)
MGLLLLAVRYLSYVLMFCFATVCLACGLYYFAELVEEHEKTAKKFIRYSIYVVFVAHVFVWFEGFPFLCILSGLITHFVYYKLLDQFPNIKLTNILFIIACVFFIISHTLWFNHFTSVYYSFEDVLGFFILCVWSVPFSFFISLSTDETTLPYTAISASGDSIGEATKRSGRSNLLHSFLQNIQGYFKKPDRSTDFKAF